MDAFQSRGLVSEIRSTKMLGLETKLDLQTKLDRFLEAFQLKSNRDRHDKTGIRRVAKRFAEDDWMQSILVSESKTLSIALHSKFFQAIVALVALGLILNALSSGYSVVSLFVVRGRYFRFVLKDPMQPNSILDLESAFFQYESRNCEWPQKRHNASIQDGVLQFMFEETVGITGWSIKRKPHSQINSAETLSISDQSKHSEALSNHDSRLNLQRSFDGSRWEVLNPPWLQNSPVLQTVNFRPSHCWIVREIITPAVLSMFMFAGCFKSVHGEVNAGKYLIALGWFSSFCLMFSVEWCDVSQDLARACATYLAFSV